MFIVSYRLFFTLSVSSGLDHAVDAGGGDVCGGSYRWSIEPDGDGALRQAQDAATGDFVVP